MEDDVNAFMIWWHRYGQHITALSVLLLLIFSAYQITVHNKLQKEIKQNCGWEQDENYYCVCEKGLAVQEKIKLNSTGTNPLPLNVTLDK